CASLSPSLPASSPKCLFHACHKSPLAGGLVTTLADTGVPPLVSRGGVCVPLNGGGFVNGIGGAPLVAGVVVAVTADEVFLASPPVEVVVVPVALPGCLFSLPTSPSLAIRVRIGAEMDGFSASPLVDVPLTVDPPLTNNGRGGDCVAAAPVANENTTG